MASLGTELFNGGSEGATVTTSNTSGTSVTGTSAITLTGTPTSPEGVRWMKVVSTGTLGTWRKDHTASATVWAVFHLRLETTDVVSTFFQVYSNTTLVLGLRQQADNTIQVRDGTTTRYTSPALTPGTTYQFEVKATPSTASTGTIMNIYDESGTLLHTSGNQSLNIAAVGTTDNARIGHVAGSPTTTSYFDRFLTDDAASPGILTSLVTKSASDTGNVSITDSSSLVTTSAVSANAGADQSSIQPYSTVTLTGSGSGGDGSYTYSWSQISGTSVTLSGSGTTRTFTAPAGQSAAALVFRLTVDDGTGGGSAVGTDDVTINVLPHNYYRKRSGGWGASRIRSRVGGSWQ